MALVSQTLLSNRTLLLTIKRRPPRRWQPQGKAMEGNLDLGDISLLVRGLKVGIYRSGHLDRRYWSLGTLRYATVAYM